METIHIYRIINLVNNKVYIGSTLNKKLRINNHKNKLINKCHNNLELQKDYTKYGDSNFIFEYFVTDVPFIGDINRGTIENFFIDLYDSYNKGYNQVIAGSTINYNGIYCYNKKGCFIKSYKSVAKASRDLEICASSIAKCLKKKRLSAGNYLWSYKKNDGLNLVDELKNNTKKGKSNSKIVKQYTKTGKYIKTFKSITEAAIETNIKISNISSVLKKGFKYTAGGYKWKN